VSDNGHDLKSIELPPAITVRDLAQEIDASPIEVIKTLMANGVMANINQQIDFDTAAIVAAEMGYEATLETPEAEEEEEKGEIPLWRKLIAGENPDTVKPPFWMPFVTRTSLGAKPGGSRNILAHIR
jgi:translation initiation factor IF-2